MKHYILAKFCPEVQREKVLPRIREIFAMAPQVPGVHSAEVFSCCIDRANRMDVMIVLDMEKSALPVYDECTMHHLWKEEFSPMLESKSIFDCE